MKAKFDFRRCIAVAIAESQYEYLEMTGKKEFRAVEKSIPEKCIEVSVARKLWQNVKGHDFHVIQEYSFSYIARNLKERFGDTRSKKFDRVTKRVDISITDNDGKLFSLIEIKRKGSLSDRYKNKDIDRLLSIKSYVKERTGRDLLVYFAYASTMHFVDDEMYDDNIRTEQENAEDKFGNKNFHMYFDKERTYKLAEGDLFFCFGAICGQL